MRVGSTRRCLRGQMQRARKPDQLFRAGINGIAHATSLCIGFPLPMRIACGQNGALRDYVPHFL